MPLLGAHLSIRGGLKNIEKQCKYLNCVTFQIFSKNQLRWYAPPIEEDDLLEFKKFVAKENISAFVIHSSYLINIASSNDHLRKKSINALVDELRRAEVLGASVFVLHPGSPRKPEKVVTGLKRVIDALCRAIEESNVKKVKIAVENTAGSGYLLGKNLHELVSIVEGVEKCGYEIGVCIDTAHAFQSGYTLDNRFINDVYNLLGRKILVVHINDSLTEQGSRKDRHANIGKGHISLDFFESLVNDNRLGDIPFILETPGGLAMFKKDIETLRSMINEKV